MGLQKDPDQELGIITRVAFRLESTFMVLDNHVDNCIIVEGSKRDDRSEILTYMIAESKTIFTWLKMDIEYVQDELRYWEHYIRKRLKQPKVEIIASNEVEEAISTLFKIEEAIESLTSFLCSQKAFRLVKRFEEECYLEVIEMKFSIASLHNEQKELVNQTNPVDAEE